MRDTVLARIAALKTMAMPDLKRKWRELFDSDPRPTTGASWKAGSPTGSRNSPTAG
jgi:hypothetical protein